MTKAIIFLNGNLSDFSKLKKYIDKNDEIICADGGANFAVKYGIIPHVVIGDLDSIENDIKKNLEAKPVTFISYPKDKDYTDSELAIQYALEKNYTEVIITGLLGDRLDHFMANIMYISSLQRSKENSSTISIINGNQILSIINKTITFSGNIGDNLSLIPLHDEVRGITTQNLQYSLQNETLPLGSTRGISNVFIEETVKVELKKGTLLTVHTEIS